MAPKSNAFPGVEHSELETIPVEGTIAAVMDDPERRRAYINARTAEVPHLQAEIVRRLSNENTLDVLWHANWLEMSRVQQMTNIPASDLAGQLRYLRSVLVVRPISIGHGPCSQESFDAIMLDVERLWRANFESRMLEIIAGPKGTREERRAETAGLMALIQSGETEVSYVELAWDRLERIVSPFESGIVCPVFGGGVAELRAAFHRIEKYMEDAVHTARRRYPRLGPRTGLPPIAPSMEPDPSKNPGSMFCLNLKVVAELIQPLRLEGFLDQFVTPFGTAPTEKPLPIDNPLIKTKPFARLEESLAVIIDPLHFLFAPKYVLPALFTSTKALARLQRRRDTVLEEDGVATLAKMVSPSGQYTNFFIRHSDGCLREHDGLLVRHSVGFVIECKAKPLRSFVRTDANVRKAMDDFGDSIQRGYDQGARLARLLSAGAVDICDERGKRLDTVGPLKRVHVIVVLDSSAKLLGTDLEPWLEVQDDVGYPWVIDQDTLRVIGTKLSGFKSMGRFLDWRTRQHGRMLNEDEACFAGFFLQHGAQRVPDNTQMFLETTYSDIFDAEYFRRRGLTPPRVRFDARPTVTTMTRNKQTIELGMGQLRQERR